MNFLHDIVAPLLGSLIYINGREWLAARRALERGAVLPAPRLDDGPVPGDMPIVGASSTADERLRP